MRRYFGFFLWVVLVGCGGSGSPSGPSTDPSPNPNPNPNPVPSTPTVKERSFTLESLSINSGVEPFVMRPPQASGGLSMRADGAYTLTFSIAVEAFVWSKKVTGQHRQYAAYGSR